MALKEVQPPIPDKFRKRFGFTEEELQSALKVANDMQKLREERAVDLEYVERIGDGVLRMLMQASPEKPIRPFDLVQLSEHIDETIIIHLMLKGYMRWKSEGKLIETPPAQGYRHVLRKRDPETGLRRLVGMGDVGGFYPK